MLFSRFASAIALTFATSAAFAGPIQTLYDGNGDPSRQGWSVEGSGTQVAHEGTTEFSTVNDPGGRTSQMYLFKYDTKATNYIASLRLQVLSSSYNNLDAALTFSPFGDRVLSSYTRANTFMIANGKVLWGDEASSVSLDTGAFHDYQIRYDGSQLSLYIDATFADIASGAATAALSRAVSAPDVVTSMGHLVWGDATNDPNYNSHYIVDSVSFQDLDAADVPEPSTFLLMGLGGAGLLLRRRRDVHVG
ncbi:PEP-CTERM sorting domain-containing protein [uncultured Massilia sp.]|uniref:PEP-CTERM sorting domain-containing protein n=1 Tax=uncultured Massilia sp. TaxID=169973 RepID=UPI0025825BB4|nr:PEP-CTERM sorting domain-containing protein [uncultured Massilia sp.]